MQPLLALLPILALTIALAAILVSLWMRPRYALAWVSAALGGLVAWGIALFMATGAPTTILIPGWGSPTAPPELLPTYPQLRLDSVSWSFMLALLGLHLAAVLTQAVYAGYQPGLAGRGPGLAAGLAISITGILGVMAGDVIALLMTWAAVDMLESVIWLLLAQNNEHNRQVAQSLLVRWLGLGLAIAGSVRTAAEGQSLGFAPMASSLQVYLIAAAGVRLGALPLRPPQPEGLAAPPGLAALLRLAPAASSLMLLARAAQSGALPEWNFFLLLLAGVAALLGGLAWLRAEPPALHWWISATSGLAVAAAVRGQPQAALAWGVALLCVGGAFSMAAIRSRPARFVLLGLAFSMAGLPFSPTWPAAGLTARPITPLLPIFLLAHTVLLAGVIRQGLRPAPVPPRAERWVYVIYPLGLAWLLVSLWLVAWLPQGALLVAWPDALSSALILIGPALAFASLPFLMRSRISLLKDRAGKLRAINFLWIYRLIGRLFHALTPLSITVNRAIEGQAGLLWALVFLALLISLFAQLGLGGG